VNPYTIGVEEEFQVIDPASGELTALPADGPDGGLVTREGFSLKRELHQSALEVDTGICASVSEVEQRLLERRASIHGWCQDNSLGFVAASTHPFSDWRASDTTPSARYLELVDLLQDVGRGNLIYGLHIHVGVPDPKNAFAIMGQVCPYLPYLLALSCSSPFWLGRETGLKSSRTAVFSRVPRTGIPPRMSSYAEYEDFVATLQRTGCIKDATQIWWDLRMHPAFPTLEFRICDMPTRVRDSITIAALAQAIVAKVDAMLRRGCAPEPPRPAYVLENKWRAARFGVRGPLVDFHRGEEREPAEFVDDLIDLVDDVVDTLDSRRYVERARELVAAGTSAERQLAAYRASGGDIGAVLEQLRVETVEGLGVEPR